MNVENDLESYTASPLTTLKDSGSRRRFATGAIRDMGEGKGRCDLMPLEIVARILNKGEAPDIILTNIHLFQTTGHVGQLFRAMLDFIGCVDAWSGHVGHGPAGSGRPLRGRRQKVWRIQLAEGNPNQQLH